MPLLGTPNYGPDVDGLKNPPDCINYATYVILMNNNCCVFDLYCNHRVSAKVDDACGDNIYLN